MCMCMNKIVFILISRETRMMSGFLTLNLFHFIYRITSPPSPTPNCYFNLSSSTPVYSTFFITAPNESNQKEAVGASGCRGRRRKRSVNLEQVTIIKKQSELTYFCMHKSSLTHTHTYIHIHIYIYIRIHTYIYTHTYIYIYAYTVGGYLQ